MADPFVSAPCSVVINTNYDTVGSLTRATVDHLTTAQLKALFTRDSGATWVDTAPWFKTAFEMTACGIKRNGMYDWIFGNMKSVGKLVNVTKLEKSPSLVQPFILARQLSVINKEYWSLTGGVIKAQVVTTSDATNASTDFTKTPLTSFPSSSTALLRIKTRGSFDLDAKWFLSGTAGGGNGKQGDRVNTFTRVSGAAKMGQYTVLSAAVSPDKTFVDLAVLEENPGSPYNDHQTMPATSGTATALAGVMVPGINNVSDFESWCSNRPTLNPEKRVPFWYQTTRKARRIDDFYKEVFARLMRDNQYFAEFVDLPLAEKNRQDEEVFQRRKVNAFFFNKPISDNQTLALYQSLEQVVTTTPSIANAGSTAVQGKFVTYRSNFVGVYEQLKTCTRVYDIANNPISLAEFFNEVYNISRSRKSRGRNGIDIDIYTDTKTAAAFEKAMMRYYNDQYLGNLRLVQNIKEGQNEAFGFFWRSYRLNYPIGVTLHVITHETFDDWRNAFNVEGIDTRGALFLALDLGKGGIYPGMIASNRRTRTLGELENLARIDPTYFCTLEHFTEEVTLSSETMTVVVECPSDNIWVENFDGFHVTTAFQPFSSSGTATDLIGDVTDTANVYK